MTYSYLANVPQLDVAKKLTYKTDIIAQQLLEKVTKINNSIHDLFVYDLTKNTHDAMLRNSLN